MKKTKYLATLCVALMCALSLTLVACGGGEQKATENATTEETTQVETAPADPAEAFIGTWKFAGAEANGMTMSGDLSGILSMIGYDGDASFSLTFEKDGKGSAVFADEASSFTWVMKDDTTATITPEKKAADAEVSDDEVTAENEAAADAEEEAEAETTLETADVVLEDGVLKMSMGSDTEGTMLFTADGTMPNAVKYDLSTATAITSEDALKGTWTFSGMNMFGITFTGDSAAIAEQMGSEDATVTFSDGGTADFMGSEATWSVSADGAVLSSDGTDIPIKALGNDIVIDMSEMLGTELAIVLSK